MRSLHKLVAKYRLPFGSSMIISKHEKYTKNMEFSIHDANHTI